MSTVLLGGTGGTPPQENVQIRCPEIASQDPKIEPLRKQLSIIIIHKSESTNCGTIIH